MYLPSISCLGRVIGVPVASLTYIEYLLDLGLWKVSVGGIGLWDIWDW